MRPKRNWCTLFGVNLFVLILYCAVIVLSVVTSMIVMLASDGSLENLEYTTGIPFALILAGLETLMIGLPVLVFIAAGRPGAQLLKVTRSRFSEILIAVGMAIGGYGVFTFLEVLTQMALSSLNLPIQGLDITISNGWELAAWIFVLGVLPAFMEEFAFRGVVLGVYEQHMRPGWAILLSAVLFGMLHMQIAFFYFFIGIGVIMGWAVYRSRSIWPGAAIHFTHNTLSAISAYLQQIYPDFFINRLGLSTVADGYMEREAWGLWAAIAAASAVFFVFCLLIFNWKTKERTPVFTRHTPRSFVDWAPVAIVLAGMAVICLLSAAGVALLQSVPSVLSDTP